MFFLFKILFSQCMKLFLCVCLCRPRCMYYICFYQKIDEPDQTESFSESGNHKSDDDYDDNYDSNDDDIGDNDDNEDDDDDDDNVPLKELFVLEATNMGNFVRVETPKTPHTVSQKPETPKSSDTTKQSNPFKGSSRTLSPFTTPVSVSKPFFNFFVRI